MTRVLILGLGVSAVTLKSAVAVIEGWIAAGQRNHVCVASAHGVIESPHDKHLRDIHKRAGLLVPDGTCSWRAGLAFVLPRASMVQT